MACSEEPKKRNPDVAEAVEETLAVELSAPIIVTVPYWHSADVTGKDSDQRYKYIKELPSFSDNPLHSAMYTSLISQ